MIIRGAKQLLSNPNCKANEMDSTISKIDYLKQRLFYLESQILACIQFNTSKILTIDFIHYFAFNTGFSPHSKELNFCLYLMNICYHSLIMQSLPKSLLGCSIVYFVCKIFGKENMNFEKNMNKGDQGESHLVHVGRQKKLELFYNCQKIFQNKFRSNLEERIGDEFLFDLNVGQDHDRDCLEFSKGSNELFQNNNFLKDSQSVNNCSIENFKHVHHKTDSNMNFDIKTNKNSPTINTAKATNHENINFNIIKVKSLAVHIFSSNLHKTPNL